jgi:serine/threonine protein kinase
MNHYEIVNFLATNHLLTFEEMVADEFSLEIKKESFQIAFVNRATPNINEKKYFLKIGLGNSKLEQFYLRKENFVVQFFSEKADGSLHFDFENKEQKYFLNTKSSGLYRDATVLVRHFFSIIDEGERIRDFGWHIKEKKSTEIIKKILDVIVIHLQKIHAIDVLELESKAIGEFSANEIYQFPWELDAVKLAKNAETGYQNLFWKNINPQTLNLAINAFKNETKKRFVHGDLSPKNILVFEKDNEFDVKFIDWEMWHIGDSNFDVDLFVSSFEKYFPKNHTELKEYFITKYYSIDEFEKEKQRYEVIRDLTKLNASYLNIMKAKSETEILANLQITVNFQKKFESLNFINK